MLKYLTHYKKGFISVIMMYGIVTFDPLGLVAVQQMIYSTIEYHNWDLLSFSAVLAFLYIVSSLLLGFIHESVKKRYYSKTMALIHQKTAKGILNQNYIDMKDKSEGSYLSLMNNDIPFVEDNYIRVFFVMIGSIIQLILALIYVFYFNVMIGFVILGVSFIGMILPQFISRNLGRYNNENMKQQGEYTGFLKNLFAGYDTMQQFLAKSRLFRELSKVNILTQKTKNHTILKNNMASSYSATFNLFCVFLLLLVCGYQVMQGDMDITTMLTLTSLSDCVFYPLIEIVNIRNQMKSTDKVRAHLLEVMNIENHDEEGEDIKGDFEKLELEALDFTYPNADKQALKQVSFTLEKGKKYAVVGNSGCGKSTLIKVLLKNYDEYRGHAYVNGQEISKISLTSLYEKISVIPQRIFMFQTTIRNNITLYDDVSDYELQAVIHRAGLCDVIDALADGLDTMIEENGNNFSGGEQQRIAIARAYLKKSEVLILDEATSALDNKTAKEIDDVLLRDETLTCLSITHRLQPELLRRYDQILVFDQGSIVEQGTFDELLAKGSQFQSLYRSYLTS